MPTTSHSPDCDLSPAAPAELGASKPRPGELLLKYFLRCIIVGFGIAIGLIASLFIGLVTGWIEFTC